MMKGICPGSFTYGVILWLMTGLVAPTEAQEQHWCEITHANTTYVEDLCGNFITQFFAGYELDIEKSNLTHLTPEQLQESLLVWATDPENGPDCTFVSIVETTENECCAGWEGDNCTIAICNPACQNNGSCIAPGVCECLPDFAGLRCAESMIELTTTLKYCYLSDSCYSATLVEGVVTKDACCLAGGAGWGIYDGDCDMCQQGAQAMYDPDYNPDQSTDKSMATVKKLMATTDKSMATADKLEVTAKKLRMTAEELMVIAEKLMATADKSTA